MAKVQSVPGRRPASRLGLLLALGLLFAQTGALVHACSHLRAAGERQGAPAPSSMCGDCLSFAPLLAAAGGTGPAPPAVVPESGTRYRMLTALLVGQARHRAFRSRAPPSLSTAR
jgi:hypothetical protein